MKHPLTITHAPQDAARAAEIAVTLAALGYDVEASAKPGKAERLVVLWSEAAARSPRLRAAARRAQGRGGVIIVRLDAAKAPASLGGARALKLARGVGDAALWRRVLSVAEPAAREAASTQSVQRSSRLAGVGAALTMAACVATALYLSDAAFAARVDALAGVAQAQAAVWVSALKGDS